MKEIMSSYRCPTCNKLLLRGFIVIGEIESKCRYCKKIVPIYGISGKLTNEESYLLITDRSGKILKTSTSIQAHLDYSPEELLKMNVSEVLKVLVPNLCDVLWKKLRGNPRDALYFMAVERPKNGMGKPKNIQVMVHSFVSVYDTELLLFNVDHGAKIIQLK